MNGGVWQNPLMFEVTLADIKRSAWIS